MDSSELPPCHLSLILFHRRINDYKNIPKIPIRAWKKGMSIRTLGRISLFPRNKSVWDTSAGRPRSLTRNNGQFFSDNNKPIAEKPLQLVLQIRMQTHLNQHLLEMYFRHNFCFPRYARAFPYQIKSFDNPQFFLSENFRQ